MRTKHRISRWSFFIWYVLVLLIIAGGTWLYDTGINIAAYIAFGLAVFFLLILEIAIREKVLIIGDHGVTYKQGILTSHFKKINYGHILDVGVRQNFIQRLLGYGDLDIDTGGTAEIEIPAKNIISPTKAERIIEERRRKAHYYDQAGQYNRQRPVQGKQYAGQNQPMERMGQAQRRRTQ